MNQQQKRKISVVIPYYKGKKYIEQTVASVINQPYKNIEILLINDGSPDDGDDVCRALADQWPCIRYYKKSNEGIGPTRNFGLEHATGEYIQFLDQDDVWVKDFLDEQTVGAIFSGGDVVSFSLYHCNHDFSRGRPDFVENQVLIGGGVKVATAIWRHHSSMFFRRQMLLDYDIRVPPTRNEDEIFRHKCLYVSKKVTCIDKLMFLYRNNPASETHKKYKTEDLYGPILGSWKGLLQWHQETHPADLEAQHTYKTLFCVYAMEAVETLCASKHKLSVISKIAGEHLYHDDLVEYMQSLKDMGLRKRIEDYIEHPGYFARKCRIKACKEQIGRCLLKIPPVKLLYLKKKYPIDLTGMNVLF